MDDYNIPEDAIDLEALQAQIDVSMSFAHEMVSSWIKPSQKLVARRRETEMEIREYMRRPPRLGVGTRLPEHASLSLEFGRLKGQLSEKNKKRSLGDDNAGKAKNDTDNSEEDSRAGTIKKKARIDPFKGRNIIPKDTKAKVSTSGFNPAHGRAQGTSVSPPQLCVPEVVEEQVPCDDLFPSTTDEAKSLSVENNFQGLPQLEVLSKTKETDDDSRLARTASLCNKLLNLEPLPSNGDDYARTLPPNDVSMRKKRRKRRKKVASKIIPQ